MAELPSYDEVLDALADMASQHFIRYPDGIGDGCLSANEQAADVLVRAGVLRPIGRNRYFWRKAPLP